MGFPLGWPVANCHVYDAFGVACSAGNACTWYSARTGRGYVVVAKNWDGIVALVANRCIVQVAASSYCTRGTLSWGRPLRQEEKQLQKTPSWSHRLSLFVKPLRRTGTKFVDDRVWSCDHQQVALLSVIVVIITSPLRHEANQGEDCLSRSKRRIRSPPSAVEAYLSLRSVSDINWNS